MQEPSYVGTIALVSIWFRMELTQIITWVYKGFSHLDIPIDSTDITILIAMGRFLDTLIDAN